MASGSRCEDTGMPLYIYYGADGAWADPLFAKMTLVDEHLTARLLTSKCPDVQLYERYAAIRAELFKIVQASNDIKFSAETFADDRVHDLYFRHKLTGSRPRNEPAP